MAAKTSGENYKLVFIDGEHTTCACNAGDGEKYGDLNLSGADTDRKRGGTEWDPK